jgi:hypothetical protein
MELEKQVTGFSSLYVKREIGLAEKSNQDEQKKYF